MHTSEQTSVRRFAVRSLISLCLMDGNPPLGHDKACSIQNHVPHPHVACDCNGCQLYLRARASWKALLCRVNPNSSIGKEVSHEEAPFSWASCIAHLSVWGRSSFRRSAPPVAWSCTSQFVHFLLCFQLFGYGFTGVLKILLNDRRLKSFRDLVGGEKFGCGCLSWICQGNTTKASWE